MVNSFLTTGMASGLTQLPPPPFIAKKNNAEVHRRENWIARYQKAGDRTLYYRRGAPGPHSSLVNINHVVNTFQPAGPAGRLPPCRNHPDLIRG